MPLSALSCSYSRGRFACHSREFMLITLSHSLTLTLLPLLPLPVAIASATTICLGEDRDPETLTVCSVSWCC